MRRLTLPLLFSALLAGGACASLGQAVLAPRFEVSGEQPEEFLLLGPSLQRPLGGASLRVYARVENPNPFGLTLNRVTGQLRLEQFDAADVDLPLGLPLNANQSSVVPLDIAISFDDLPALADVLGRAVTTGRVGYDLRGMVTVDAGVLGQPTFGPIMLLEGVVETRR